MKEFRIHEDYPSYRIYSDGRIYSTHKSGKFLSPKVDKDGYLEVCLTENKVRYYKRVHRLVAEAFIPNPENFPVVNHIDEVKDNNKVDNLEWCSVYHNTCYSLPTEQDKILQVKDLYLSGMDYQEIIDYLGLPYKDTYSISEILSGRKHSSITGITFDLRDPKRSAISKGCLSEDIVSNILINYFRDGLKQTELCHKYSLSPTSMSRICNGNRYKELFTKIKEKYG